MSREWFGWKGRILRVNLSKGKAVKQELPAEWARNYIGCRGINAKILYDEVKTGTDAFGPENLLIFGAGPLDGTPVGMGKLSLAAKSPRGCIAEGGLGGFFGSELKFAGYDHIIVEGIAEKPVYIWIDDDDVEIKDAIHLWGKTIRETDIMIKEEIGDKNIQICYIGPAGENLVPCPVLTSLGSASGGRLDCGTVMGSKKLKAVAVKGSGGVKIARPEEFDKAFTKMCEILNIKKGMDQYLMPYFIFGSTSQMRIFSAFGLHSYNAQKLRFEYSDDVSGEKFLEKYVVRPWSCFSCIIPCKFWYEIRDGPYAGTKGGNFQAGGQISLTSLVGVKDLAAALKAWTMCNQLGLDVYMAGYTIAWAMECFEKGIITTKDTDGIELRFGNHEAMLEMIRKIAYRDGFGDTLADGIDKAAKKIGKGSERFALTIKGRELEVVPERTFYLGALGVAVSETGPDHTRWYPPYPPNPGIVPPGLLEELNLDIDLKRAFKTRLPEGKGILLKFLEDHRAVVESIPSCVYTPRGILSLDLRLYGNMLVAGTGMSFTYEELMTAGERIRNIERAFIVREGFRRKDDMIPKRMREDPVPDSYVGPLTTEAFNHMLEEYYEARGWDKKTAIPMRKKLKELELGYVAEEFDRLGIEVT